LNDQTEHDAERFLTALEEKVQELLVLSKIPVSNPAKLSFVDYKKFREKSDECLSFLVIIEGRISEVEGERKELLSEQFDKLVVATWSVLMEGSIGFLTVLSERDYLPVGTRHVFEQELKTLSEAEGVMKENQNQKLLADNMAEKRAKAKEILNVVIERAPGLLNVEDNIDGAIKSYSEVVSTLDPDQEANPEETLDDVSTSEPEAKSDVATASKPEVSPDAAVYSEPEETLDDVSTSEPEAKSDVATDSKPEVSPDAAVSSEPEETLDDVSTSEPEAKLDVATESKPEVSPDAAVSSEEGLGSNLNSELDNENDPNIESLPESDREADLINSSVAES